MAAAGKLIAARLTLPGSVALTRMILLAVLLVGWEALAASGLFYRDVIPSLSRVARALGEHLADSTFYFHLSVTAYEVGVSLLIGALAGLAVGLVLGGNRFLSRAFEPYLYYLGPTPKIIFFPIMIMGFGVGSGSKIAIGVVSCFFPVALSVAAGMREIDRVLIRVGQSFRASTMQMITKIYLPAMRYPVVNGLRLGLGVAIIGVLLAETKFANRGLGYLIIQAYARFDMPSMYSLLMILFVLAIAANALVGRLGGIAPRR